MTNILRRAESMNLRDKIFDILVPTETEVRTRQQKKTEVKRKVFPGYVLIDMVLDDATWYLVKSTTGVTGFVSSGNKPVPLQEKEIQLILDSVRGDVPTPVVKFEKGEVVRVVSGPFSEFTGKIEEVNADKEKLRVLISIFGRDTPVELDFQQVEKVI
jgi:transcriptional antiterminator NusG